MKAVDKLTSAEAEKELDRLAKAIAEAEKVEERFTAGERNSPVGYFERRTPRAWASGARPQ